jgi:ferredoxin
MKIFVTLLALEAVQAFVPAAKQRMGWRLAMRPSEMVPEVDVLTELAKKLRMRAFDVDTAVYGLESKDPLFGIENVRTTVHIKPSLGLELTEIAHSELDHRGLVMISKVDGNALHETPIHVGDVIIGVFAGDGFKESTTGMDYDETVDTISRAKTYAIESDLDTITLELNRVVKKAKVKVQVEDEDGKVTELDALAGDNLRLLLLHNNAKLYDKKMHRLDQPNLTGDCAGEGICGTCMVSVVEGMNHLNKIGPQEQSILMHRPEHWRAACKTVIGADNQESTLRIKLHPQSVKHSETKIQP